VFTRFTTSTVYRKFTSTVKQVTSEDYRLRGAARRKNTVDEHQTFFQFFFGDMINVITPFDPPTQHCVAQLTITLDLAMPDGRTQP
jgi:hypothetical protein